MKVYERHEVEILFKHNDPKEKENATNKRDELIKEGYSVRMELLEPLDPEETTGIIILNKFTYPVK